MTTQKNEKDQNQDRWECGPHANAWGGHDARCRRVPANEKDRPPVVTDSRCDCANTQGTHEIVCPYWPLSLNGAPRIPPGSTTEVES